MPITLTITAETVSEFNVLLSTFAGEKAARRKKAEVEAERIAETGAEEPTPAPELETIVAPAASEPATEKRRGRPPKTAPTEAIAPLAPSAPAAPEKVWQLADIRAALNVLLAQNKKDTARAIVENVGKSPHISAIPPDLYPAVMAALERARD